MDIHGIVLVRGYFVVIVHPCVVLLLGIIMHANDLRMIVSMKYIYYIDIDEIPGFLQCRKVDIFNRRKISYLHIVTHFSINKI